MVTERAERIVEMLATLLGQSSLTNVNEPDSIVFVGASHRWNKLDVKGQRLHSRLLNELNRYEPLVEVLVRVAPEDVRKCVVAANKTLRELADRSHLSPYATPEEALKAARDALAEQNSATRSASDRQGFAPASAGIWTNQPGE